MTPECPTNLFTGGGQEASFFTLATFEDYEKDTFSPYLLSYVIVVYDITSEPLPLHTRNSLGSTRP